MRIRAAFTSPVLLVGLGMFSLVGCTNNPPDASSSNGHQMGYTDAPPKDTGPGAPGMQRTNDSSNPLPAGGLTPPPARMTPDDSGPSNTTK
jgi:hypothetical protein